MPLRSLRTRLVALFLVSLAIAAFLFAAVAVRQFSQEERSRARSELSRQSLQIVKLIEEFAEKRLQRRGGRAARLRDAASAASRTRTCTSSGAAACSPPIDEVRLRPGAEGHRGAARTGRCSARQDARAQTLNLKLADGTSTIAAAAGFRYGRPADRRDRRGAAGALDQRLDARAGPPLRAAAAAGAGGGGARRAAAQPAHHAPGARADRGQRAHRAAATTTCTWPRRAPTSSASSRSASSRWRASSRRRASTSATS